MKMLLETDGVEADAFLRDFLRVTLGFATWHYESQVTGVRVRLETESDRRGLLEFRCGIHGDTRAHGVVQAGATGRDPCEALQNAADLFEVSLYETIEEAPWPGAQPLAA
jgi:hypothetical protein